MWRSSFLVNLQIYSWHLYYQMNSFTVIFRLHLMPPPCSPMYWLKPSPSNFEEPSPLFSTPVGNPAQFPSILKNSNILTLYEEMGVLNYGAATPCQPNKPRQNCKRGGVGIFWLNIGEAEGKFKFLLGRARRYWDQFLFSSRGGERFQVAMKGASLEFPLGCLPVLSNGENSGVSLNWMAFI